MQSDFWMAVLPSIKLLVVDTLHNSKFILALGSHAQLALEKSVFHLYKTNFEIFNV